MANHEEIDEKIDYTAADEYWKDQPATVDGMLGGFGHISSVDVQGSSSLIKKYFHPTGSRANKIALDGGAGIGRVTKKLLLPLFDTVDLVEQNSGFLVKSHEFLDSVAPRIGHRFCCGLQDFTPEAGRYDLIWVQWVVIYLTDDDFVDFLVRCKKGLSKTGLIGIKENTTRHGREFDESDCSSTRTDEQMVEIYKRAGLKVVEKVLQEGFPDGLYPVIMYILE